MFFTTLSKKQLSVWLLGIIIFMVMMGPVYAQRQTPDFEAQFIAETTSLSNERPTWLALSINIMEEGWYFDVGKSSFSLELPSGLKLSKTQKTSPFTHRAQELNSDGVLFEITPVMDTPLAALLPINLAGTATFCQTDDPTNCHQQNITKSLTLTTGSGDLSDQTGAKFQALRRNIAPSLPWVGRAVTENDQNKIDISIYVEAETLNTLDQVIAYQSDSLHPIKGTINSEQELIKFVVTLDKGTNNQERFKGYIKLDDQLYQINLPIIKTDVRDEATTSGLQANQTTPQSTMTLWLALLSAFIGGLILNLMPCVFPILAIKAFSLVKAGSQSRSAMVEDGISYSLGVMTTFLVVAAALISFQSMGQQIGWGFQLQNPYFIMVLIAIMLAVAFNLLGLFEVQLPRFLSNLINKNQNTNTAFGTGILATVMATPCTAPFMGSALGFALGQPPLYALSIFLVLGVGMAFPYLMLSMTPSLARKMPKPGPWMVTFKKALSIPVFLTITWLLWVFYLQTGGEGLGLLILLSAIAVMLSISLKLARNKGRLLKVVLFALAFGGVHFAFVNSEFDRNARTKTQLTPLAEGIETTAFSTKNIAYYRRQGRPVFINFTASWCITCKVTERLLFTTNDFQEVMRNNNIVYMVADWTNPDPEIDAYLKSKGRQGIPFYLFHPNDGVRDDIILPDVLTLQTFKDAVE